MPDFSLELNEDQRAIQEMAESFAAERVAPHALDWDREKHFPSDVIRETGPLGFGGIYVKDDVGGSGLGLTISKRLVEVMGGRIWVEEAVGGGCVVAFEIPGEEAVA